MNAVRLQAITWGNMDPDLFGHMSSPDHDELIELIEHRSIAKIADSQYISNLIEIVGDWTISWSPINTIISDT